MVKATVKKASKAIVANDEEATSPAFPYSTKPNSLRKFLKEIPGRPKPQKVAANLLKAWGFKDTNDATIIRVLKALGMIGSDNVPTDEWRQYQDRVKGPLSLASMIRRVWAPLFEHDHAPYKQEDQIIRNYFNIHSGGSENTIGLQIQTFKAVCEHADFSGGLNVAAGIANDTPQHSRISEDVGVRGGPAIHIDLHIHLPENKSRRDYEYIFEDIARHIYGRDTDRSRDD